MEKLIVCDKIVRVRCAQTGGYWVSTSIWDYPVVVLESYANYVSEISFCDFDEFFKYCKETGIRNCDPYFNWLKKPKVWVNDVTTLSHYNIGARNFKGFSAQITYEPRPDWSIDYLRKELPAEDFVLLCKSQDWKVF